MLFVAGCASTGPAPDAGDDTPPAEAAEPQARPENAPQGRIDIDLTSVLGQQLFSRVDLLDYEGYAPIHLDVPEGKLECKVAAAAYRAYIHVYENGVPVLADIQEIEVRKGETAFLLLNLLEGATGALALRDFDADGDLAIDAVELGAGTSPHNAAEIPGRSTLVYESPVIAAKSGWYRGELQARSHYGRGQESVGQLVRRSERSGLDFLAITDRNVFRAPLDPDFKSNKVVLIPAMEWGNETFGYGLVYAPRTVPDPPLNFAAAQAECIRVQAQGGIFAVAHPCFKDAPWFWGLSFVNAVQVWYRDWRSIPRMSLEQVDERLLTKEKGKFVHSIAAAANYDGTVLWGKKNQRQDQKDFRFTLSVPSANEQAEHFYDLELTRGLLAGAIAGSNSASPKVPLGRPLTYVRAAEKSLDSIIEGIRLGRTYLSAGPKGPKLTFTADVLGDGKIDCNIGGAIPIGMDVNFEVGVTGAKGKKLQLLANGRPVFSKIIEADGFMQRLPQKPDIYTAYRVRVIGEPARPEIGYGATEIYAMTSPIYAMDITQELLLRNPDLEVDKTWLRVKPVSDWPEAILPEHLPPDLARP